jgi:hypothetical protein
MATCERDRLCKAAMSASDRGVQTLVPSNTAVSRSFVASQHRTPKQGNKAGGGFWGLARHHTSMGAMM